MRELLGSGRFRRGDRSIDGVCQRSVEASCPRSRHLRVSKADPLAGRECTQKGIEVMVDAMQNAQDSADPIYLKK